MLSEDLDRIDSVPMLPAVVGRILSMIEDPNTNAVMIAEVVSKDQSLVAMILRIINSAYYGFIFHITSVNQAVVLLGFRTIRNLTMAATVMSTYGGTSQVNAFDRAEHWKHSVAVALATDLVAKQCRRKLVPDAYLVGLVHDIGRVVMDQHFSTEFDEACKLAATDDASLIEGELQYFGLSHAEIGGHIARRWNFPDSIVTAITGHHGAGTDKTWTEMAALVHIGDAIVHEIGFALANTPVSLDAQALGVFGVDSDRYEELLSLTSDAFNKADIFEGLVA